jgi:addiction module HigA family antidote
MKKLAPIHPGEVLAEDYLAPIGMSGNALALALRVPANRLSDIIRGKRGITADTALRLSRYFGTSAQFWMGLQTQYDLAIEADANEARIKREVPVRLAS